MSKLFLNIIVITRNPILSGIEIMGGIVSVIEILDGIGVIENLGIVPS